VAERDFEVLVEHHPNAVRKVLRITATLAVEVMYAATELVMDRPELDSDIIAREISFTAALYVDSFRKPRRKTSLPVR
jgi:hypothetical protein